LIGPMVTSSWPMVHNPNIAFDEAFQGAVHW